MMALLLLSAYLVCPALCDCCRQVVVGFWVALAVAVAVGVAGIAVAGVAVAGLLACWVN